MAKLYTFTINTNTGEIKRHVDNDPSGGYDGYDEEEIGYATYNDDGWENVYAESLVSAERAEQLVYSKCVEMMNKFKVCADKIFSEDVSKPDYPSYTQTIPSESKSELPSTFKSTETRATSVSGFFPM
jgi:hypothetical protein